MRVKLSKLLSAVLAICIVFVGFTAFADAPVVTVSTTYNYNEHGLDTPASADITVYAGVNGVENDTEVTFIVNGSTSEIVYIDQQTAASKSASFKFTADWLDVESALVSMGSNGGYTLPTRFTINPTVNHWTNGSLVAESDVTKEETDAYNEKDEMFQPGKSAYAFTGSVTGDVSEFGIRIGDTYFRAMGCADDGTFIVVVKNITAEEADSAVAYSK